MDRSDTEIKILNAARIVFIRKGYDGARMQEISDEAKINKALLHYYFRSKEKLFSEIFNEAFSTFIPVIQSIFGSNISLTEKIEFFVDKYLDMLEENPYLPSFILIEINRNPENWFIDFMENKGIFPKNIFENLNSSFLNQNQLAFDIRHLIINIIALCVFPYAAKPVFKGVFFNNSEAAYADFLNERKKVVKMFILNTINLK